MLAQLIQKIANTDWHLPLYRPRPSKIGPEECLRQHVYHALDYAPLKPNDRSAVVLDDSTWHEELTVNWLTKGIYTIQHRQLPITIPNALPWLTKKERPFTCTLCQQQVPSGALHGHLDWILKDLSRTRWLVEHKAINHFSFERLVHHHWPLNFFTQCTLYFQGIKAMKKRITQGLLLIKNKNTSAYIEYGLKYNRPRDILTILWKEHSNGTREDFPAGQAPTFHNLYKHALAQYAQIAHFQELALLPPRPYLKGEDWQCDYCLFSHHCWNPAPDSALEDPVPLSPEEDHQASQYHAIKKELARLTKEEKALKSKFKLLCKNHETTRAQGQHFALELQTSTQTRVDHDLIPFSVLKAARRPSPIEKLIIKPLPATAILPSPLELEAEQLPIPLSA